MRQQLKAAALLCHCLRWEPAELLLQLPSYVSTLEMGDCRAVATAATRQAFGPDLLGAAYRVRRVEQRAHSPPSMSAASLLQRKQERNAAEAASTPSSQSAGDCLIWSCLWTSPDAAHAIRLRLMHLLHAHVPVTGQPAHQPS